MVAWLEPFQVQLRGFNLELTPPDQKVSGQLERLQRRLPQSLSPGFVYSNETHSALEYERRVSLGAVPTRDCLHDWYNGLVWLTFPKARAVLNRIHLEEAEQGVQLHAGELAAQVGPHALTRTANGRTPRRDAITLFDENGAILLAHDPIVFDELAEHRWHDLFVKRRAQWGSTIKLVLFGHGLFEALHKPYKGLCAKVMGLPWFSSFNELDYSQLDTQICQPLAALVSSRQLRPLPVMGVPGWFPENSSVAFYDDRSVFREKPAG